MKTLLLIGLILFGAATARADEVEDMLFMQKLDQWDAEDAARDRRDLDAAYAAKDCDFLQTYWSRPHPLTYADITRYKAAGCGTLTKVERPRRVRH